MPFNFWTPYDSSAYEPYDGERDPAAAAYMNVYRRVTSERPIETRTEGQPMPMPPHESIESQEIHDEAAWRGWLKYEADESRHRAAAAQAGNLATPPPELPPAPEA